MRNGSSSAPSFNDRPWEVRAIAWFKLIKATLLFIVAAEALLLPHEQLIDNLAHYLSKLHPSPYWIDRFLSFVMAFDAHKQQLLGIAIGCYATVFMIEGLGLWFYQRWAEVFTVIVTGSFIPFEIYELIKHFSWLKLAIVVANAVVLWYLVVQLRRQHRKS